MQVGFEVGLDLGVGAIDRRVADVQRALDGLSDGETLHRLRAAGALPCKGQQIATQSATKVCRPLSFGEVIQELLEVSTLLSLRVDERSSFLAV